MVISLDHPHFYLLGSNSQLEPHLEIKAESVKTITSNETQIEKTMLFTDIKSTNIMGFLTPELYNIMETSSF